MSKLECVIMAAIYCALGIPLIIISINAPEVEDVTSLKKGDTKSFLNYPSDAVVAMNLLPFQKLVCEGEQMNQTITDFIKKFDKCGLKQCDPRYPCKTGCKCVGTLNDNMGICMPDKPSPSKPSKRCKYLEKIKAGKHPYGVRDLSQEFNSLRVGSLIIGIILLVLAFLKIAEAISRM